jgi:hypothetical protein
MRVPAPVVRSTAWCAVLGYALVASGLPLPFGGLPADFSAGRGDAAAARLLAGKDRSRPFPCMDKPCGCATAEQCFSSCCCHSPAERLAWARARGVEASARAAIARATPAPRPVATSASCCTKKRNCCAAEATPPGPARGAAPEADRDGGPDRDRARLTGRGRSVSLRAMLACGGIVEQWFAAGSSLPPSRVALPTAAPFVQRIAVADVFTDAATTPPDVPPPRTA